MARSTRRGARPARSIPTSLMISATTGWTEVAGSDPALIAVCSGARRSKKAWAIWLLPAFWRQRKRTVMRGLYPIAEPARDPRPSRLPQTARLVEHAPPHGARELPGARVLLAGVIR